KCPYGAPGDTRWVREGLTLSPGLFNYAADGAPLHPTVRAERAWLHEYQRATVPSIHMPRWASRITLKITDVRVERLNEISDEDAEAEGIREPTLGEIVWSGMFGMDRAACPPRTAYAVLWDEINGRRAWDSNPWVWAV